MNSVSAGLMIAFGTMAFQTMLVLVAEKFGLEL